MSDDNPEAPAATAAPASPGVVLPIEISEILKIIPHRFPFVLVDRVLAATPGVSIDCIKQVTMNEPYFRGHFPEEPLMPGVLQIEAAAQASALLVYLTDPDEEGLLVFGQVKRFTFTKPVRPGDCLNIRATFKTRTKTQGMADVVLTVDGETVSKGSLAYGKVPRTAGL